MTTDPMNAPDAYDAVVVGGGPAGATAAFCLASAGLDVCVVDKQQFPRAKTCAGLITWKTVDCLRRIYGISLDELKSLGLVRHALHDYRVFHGRSLVASGTLAFPFHLVDRTRYDHHWLRLSQTCGATVITGKQVVKVAPETGWLQLDSGERLSGRCIIGADGAWSRIRQSVFGTPRHKRRWRGQMAMTIEKRCPAAEQPAYASLHFGFVPWGYAWRFPGTDDLIVGIGNLRHKDRRPFVEGFGKFMESIGLGDKAVPPWEGHPLPFGNYLSSPARQRVLLAGDACGLADPLLGEGIFYAHRSGQLAAEAVIAARNGRCDMARHYRRSLRRHVIRELRWIKFYRNLLFTGGHIRRYRGLKLFFRLFPKRLEAAIQGRLSFGRLLVP